MDNCKILRDYAILIDRVRKYQKVYTDMEEAVTRAVDECIEEGIMADFLLEHKAEVLDMVLTEYNEEETMEMLREEARADGREEGIEEGREKGIEEGRKEGAMYILISLVKDGLLSIEQAAAKLNISVEQFHQQMKDNGAL